MENNFNPYSSSFILIILIGFGRKSVIPWLQPILAQFSACLAPWGTHLRKQDNGQEAHWAPLARGLNGWLVMAKSLRAENSLEPTEYFSPSL